MSNKIQEFFNENFGEVRATVVEDITYFVASDIARALGYKNPQKAIRDHCKRVNETFIPSNGGEQKAKIISKSDIYRLIVRSRLEKADEFESWIFDEIMPMIEETGAYIETGREEEMVIKYFPSFSQETQMDMVNDLLKQNKEYKEQLKVLMETEGLMSMNVVGKECNIGLKRLFKFLRENGIMFYKDDVNIPYQRFMDQKLFSVKETVCQDGRTHSATYATKKGLLYIQKLLKKKGYYETKTA